MIKEQLFEDLYDKLPDVGNFVIFGACATGEKILNDLKIYKPLTKVIGFIDNAVEATPVENTIFLDIASQNNQCYIKIGNPGPMITSDFLHNIFLPGYTTKHAKNTGHGLGLPSLKTIVNNNNGNITLSNEKINNINYIIFEVTV